MADTNPRQEAEQLFTPEELAELSKGDNSVELEFLTKPVDSVSLPSRSLLDDDKPTKLDDDLPVLDDAEDEELARIEAELAALEGEKDDDDDDLPEDDSDEIDEDEEAEIERDEEDLDVDDDDDGFDDGDIDVDEDE